MSGMNTGRLARFFFSEKLGQAAQEAAVAAAVAAPTSLEVCSANGGRLLRGAKQV